MKQCSPLVVFHHFSQFEAVWHYSTQHALPLVALSAPSLHASLGVGWFYELTRWAQARQAKAQPKAQPYSDSLLMVLDCQNHVGHGLRALGLGLGISVTLALVQRRRLASIATQQGGFLFECDSSYPRYVFGATQTETARETLANWLQHQRLSCVCI